MVIGFKVLRVDASGLLWVRASASRKGASLHGAERLLWPDFCSLIEMAPKMYPNFEHCPPGNPKGRYQ